MAKKRNLRNHADIRNMIEETDLKYIMLNNRLFDDFYKIGKFKYTAFETIENGVTQYTDYKGSRVKDYDFNEELTKPQLTVTFDERDFLLLILMKFLSLHSFKGYPKEIAMYLTKDNANDKRIKERIKKLQFLTGKVNNKYSFKTKERKMYPEYIEVPLINEEVVSGFEEGKIKRKFNKWHLTFDCDYKEEVAAETGEVIQTPINFFIITIYDLDLYTNGTLNAKEFITYLYLISSYNAKKDIWHSIDKLSENLNIKDARTSEKIIKRLQEIRIKDQFSTEEYPDYPLIHTKQPENYSKRVRDRERPSAYYIPIYNIKMRERLEKSQSESQDNKEITSTSVIDAEDIF